MYGERKLQIIENEMYGERKLQIIPTSKYNPFPHLTLLTWDRDGLNRISGILNLSAPTSIVLLKYQINKLNPINRTCQRKKT